MPLSSISFVNWALSACSGNTACFETRISIRISRISKAYLHIQPNILVRQKILLSKVPSSLHSCAQVVWGTQMDACLLSGYGTAPGSSPQPSSSLLGNSATIIRSTLSMFPRCAIHPSHPARWIQWRGVFRTMKPDGLPHRTAPSRAKNSASSRGGHLDLGHLRYS